MGDHFLTCSLRKMWKGDAQYSCILDTQGYVLDTCFVLKTDDTLLLLTEGASGVQLMNYLGDYCAFARQSGLDVYLRPEESTVLEFVGPEIRSVLKTLPAESNAAWPFAPSWLEAMPVMVSPTFAQTRRRTKSSRPYSPMEFVSLAIIAWISFAWKLAIRVRGWILSPASGPRCAFR